MIPVLVLGKAELFTPPVLHIIQDFYTPSYIKLHFAQKPLLLFAIFLSEVFYFHLLYETKADTQVNSDSKL